MKISVTKEKTENKQRTKAKKIVLCITFMLGVMFFIFTQWSNFTYGHVAADQMIINLTSPTAGYRQWYLYKCALTKAVLALCNNNQACLLYLYFSNIKCFKN